MHLALKARGKYSSVFLEILSFFTTTTSTTTTTSSIHAAFEEHEPDFKALHMLSTEAFRTSLNVKQLTQS